MACAHQCGNGGNFCYVKVENAEEDSKCEFQGNYDCCDKYESDYQCEDCGADLNLEDCFCECEVCGNLLNSCSCCFRCGESEEECECE